MYPYIIIPTNLASGTCKISLTTTNPAVINILIIAFIVWFILVKNFIKQPKITPAATPSIISNKIVNKTLPIDFYFNSAPELLIAIVEVTENSVILNTSLKLEAASNVKGMPFAIPKPLTYKFIKQGTNTAGLTAPKTDPRQRAKLKGISNQA